jgi:hypothetical protein
MASRRLAAALVVLAVSAGCAGSGYSYLSNREENLYFKVPDDWTVFTTKDLVEGAEDGNTRTWVRGFAAGQRPTIDNVFTIMSELPRGYVEVLRLEPDERDTIDLATLRGTNFGSDQATGEPIDPLVYEQQHPDGPLTVLGYDDNVVLSHGPHGVHIRVAIAADGTNDAAIVDQTVLVDKATTKRYVLSIGCSAKCFKANKKVIQEVIESWTLEAT